MPLHGSDTLAAAFQLGVGFAARLTYRLALLLDAQAVFLAPAPIVGIDGVEAGRAGVPMLLSSLGLVASL